jgi:ubiquinone/menaquinone biosynthesis C-methylase UbiE
MFGLFYLTKIQKMKKKKLETQYNTSAKNYHQFHVGENRKSTEIFFEIISKYIKPTKGKWRRTLLDLGCGSGSDFKHYLEQGFVCYGVDSSKKMLAMVEKSFPEIPTRRSDFSKPFSIPFRNFTDEGFSLVVSKWAMQTAKEIQPVYENVYRVLVSSGHFIFLVVHPLRQFLERKNQGKIISSKR